MGNFRLMKYKVDDEIRIKTWDSMKEEFIQSTSGNKISIHQYLWFNLEMERVLINLDTDRIVTVEEVVINVNRGINEVEHYKIKENKGGFCWTDEMIEKVLHPIPIRNRWELLDL